MVAACYSLGFPSRFFFFLLFFLSTLVGRFSTASASDHAPVGARSAGMGHASVVLPDVYSVWNNPSGLAFVRSPSFTWGIYIPFGISELSLKSLAVVFPVGQIVLAPSLSYFGYSSFYEMEASLSLARKLTPDWSLGVQMGCVKKFISQGEKNAAVLVGSLGLMGALTDRLQMGMYAYNITRAAKSTFSGERIPSIVRLGLGYQVEPSLLFVAEASKDVEMPLQWKVGAEYELLDKAFLRSGFSLGSVRQFSFGFGYRWKSLVIDMAFGYHERLGTTPHISLVWQKKS